MLDGIAHGFFGYLFVVFWDISIWYLCECFIDNSKLERLEAKMKDFEYTLECANMSLLNRIGTDQLRMIIRVDTSPKEYNLVFDYKSIDKLPHIIRCSLKDKVPFWWCSAIMFGNEYLDEMTDLTQKFKAGKSYTIVVYPAYFPTKFAPQSSAASKSEESKSNSNKSEIKTGNIILGKVPLSVVFECLYKDHYGDLPIHEEIIKIVQEIIDQNNKLKVFTKEERTKRGVIQTPIKSCYRNTKKTTTKNWISPKFKSFYKQYFGKDKLCCIVTGSEEAVCVGHIVKKKPISNAAVLWALTDTIWNKISSSYAFVSVNDVRNMIPISEQLEDEFDSLFWSFYPEFIDTQLESNQESDSKMEENDFLWNIFVVSTRPNLAISKFIAENKDKVDWRQRISTYFNDAKIFRRALGMQCFAALKVYSCNLVSHTVARQWMKYFTMYDGDSKKKVTNNNSPSFPMSDISHMKDIKIEPFTLRKNDN